MHTTQHGGYLLPARVGCSLPAAAIAATGERPRALTLYRQALDMDRELNMPAEEALSLEGIANHLADGDTVQGIEHLHQALQIYQRLGMRADIERVTARLVDLAPQQASTSGWFAAGYGVFGTSVRACRYWLSW
jgi:tetratricopeptide (TPR) repeat protein